MNKVSQYIKDSMTELRENVTWTPMSELQNYTTIVLVSLVLVTAIILLMDSLSDMIMVKGVLGNI